MNIRPNLFPQRLRESKIPRTDPRDQFYSDKSRIVFCSSFRRMMKKAQVFSLEENTSVRNRLTHSLEVADIGRSLARAVGRKLEATAGTNSDDSECIMAIVENACLLHDIGNPPFGHFGEEAIKAWFRKEASSLIPEPKGRLQVEEASDVLSDFQNFDGNPQGFRIATRLHTEIDQYGLNLSCSTLLATIKYPHCAPPNSNVRFGKKQGIFKSETSRYEEIRDACGATLGKRYFLAYLMELADDICYCLSDIADSFEKGITTSREYKAEIKRICKREQVESSRLIPAEKITSFSHQVAIAVSRQAINEASELFASRLDEYLTGDADEILESIATGRELKCLKSFARQFIYTSPEAQRIEIAGSRIVSGLLDHYGMLLRIPRSEFEYFVQHRQMPKGSGLDIEWRVFNQLSDRMLKVYSTQVKRGIGGREEWLARAKLIVDYVSGMTDDSARDVYQNFMGISV